MPRPTPSWATRSSTGAARYGRLAEGAAAWRLRLAGYRVIARNARVGGREIDLVARRGATLVLCEVKARRSDGQGGPLLAVDARKQARMRDAAGVLMARDESIERVRFDVIAVTGWRLRHVPEAF